MIGHIFVFIQVSGGSHAMIEDLADAVRQNGIKMPAFERGPYPQFNIGLDGPRHFPEGPDDACVFPLDQQCPVEVPAVPLHLDEERVPAILPRNQIYWCVRSGTADDLVSMADQHFAGEILSIPAA